MTGPRVRPGPFLTPWPGDGSTPGTPRRVRMGRGGVTMIAPGGGSAGGVELPPGSVIASSPDRFVRANGDLIFPIGTTSTKILDESPTFRSFLIVRNSSGELSPASTAIIRLGFGSPATLSSTVKLDVDEVLMFDYSVIQDKVFAIADAAGQLSILVGNVILPS